VPEWRRRRIRSKSQPKSTRANRKSKQQFKKSEARLKRARSSALGPTFGSSGGWAPGIQPGRMPIWLRTRKMQIGRTSRFDQRFANVLTILKFAHGNVEIRRISELGDCPACVSLRTIFMRIARTPVVFPSARCKVPIRNNTRIHRLWTFRRF
jgi:hypothetical protein